jgi:hypothetical protein
MANKHRFFRVSFKVISTKTFKIGTFPQLLPAELMDNVCAIVEFDYFT